MVLSEQLLEKFAATIVDRFFAEKVALNDGVTEVAQGQNLNNEQVKRLVEAVNTTAFLKKFNNPEPDANGRVVEFETASPNAVLNRLLDNAKSELHSTGNTDDEMEEHPMDLPVTRPGHEEPAVPTVNAEVKEAEERLQRHVVINRLHKTASLLKERTYQAQNTLTDATQELLTRFRKLGGADFDTFEKDAFYHMGPPAAPYLQLIRRSLRKDPADYDYADMQKYARVVDTGTKEMKLLRTMMRASQTINDNTQGQEKIASHLARIV